MRLSEAAEKLRRQAAVSVRNRNENDARELLFQKKKVMQAIEKSKDRVELLDELAAKLYEAISLKETQLIGNIAEDLETDSNDPTPVRIVSPNDEDEKDVVVKEDELSNLECDEVQQKLQVAVHSQGDLHMPNELINGQVSDEINLLQGLKDTSSFESFLEHLDLQLSRIEAELVTYLNFSTLHLGDKEKPDISKVQKSLEILHSIRQVRARIARIKGPTET
ncbi:hypothetical protein Leryth_024383 [Lithospermum erythrorhizon]|nr:hypothetical protein Leryth_024383 [Lithospermum erythrorhizon]